MANTRTRQAKRSPVTLKIKFKSATLDQFIERYSVDVSHGGIFIRTKDPLPVGTAMRFEFQLKDASPLITGEGTVVWTREHDPTRVGVAPGMGVRFDRLTEGSKQVLDKILTRKAQKGAAAKAFNDTPTRVAPSPLVADLARESKVSPFDDQPAGSFSDERTDATPLPRPIPFHSDADEFPDEAFEEATKVRSLDDLVAETARRDDDFGPPAAPPLPAPVASSAPATPAPVASSAPPPSSPPYEDEPTMAPAPFMASMASRPAPEPEPTPAAPAQPDPGPELGLPPSPEPAAAPAPTQAGNPSGLEALLDRTAAAESEPASSDAAPAPTPALAAPGGGEAGGKPRAVQPGDDETARVAALQARSNRGSSRGVVIALVILTLVVAGGVAFMQLSGDHLPDNTEPITPPPPATKQNAPGTDDGAGNSGDDGTDDSAGTPATDPDDNADDGAEATPD
ncbi:MAG: TIGR02266 family protein, partial [Myxococcota bacterium]